MAIPVQCPFCRNEKLIRVTLAYNPEIIADEEINDREGYRTVSKAEKYECPKCGQDFCF